MTITRRHLATFGSTMAIVMLALGSVLVSVRSAHAASFTVSNCATETGPGTIGQSVTDATADPGTSETITFSCGSGSHTIPITTPLIIAMPGKTLLIDGGGQIALDGGTTSQIMQITASAGTTLESMAFNRGYALNGGAIAAANSPLTLTNDTFGQNVALSKTANGVGGAVDDTGPGALAISGSTFAGNTSSNDGIGGAIYIGSGVTGGRITNSVFSQNTVSGTTFAHGGAIENDGTLDEISSDTFTDNNSSCAIDCLGGAIYNGGTITTVSDNTFTHNSVTENGQSPAAFTGAAPLADTSPGRGQTQQAHARGLSSAATLIPQVTAFYAEGGAIYSRGTITTVTTTTFTRNSATASDAFGGAIVLSGSPTTISMSTFSGNVAKAVPTSFQIVFGGAIEASGQLTITNSTFTGNSAVDTGTQPAYGGAIDVTSFATVNLVYDTLSGDSISATNSTSAGGEVYNGGTAANLTINGSIVSGGSNTSTSTATNCGGTSPMDAGYNLDSGTTCAFSSANHSLINTDPILGPLASNGGSTQTLALLQESPAIDAGGTSANGCPSTDQRGITRPQGAACDIGAYEYVPTAPIATTTTLSATPSVQTQGQPVQLCATVAAASGLGTPHGTVTFFDGSTALGTATLSAGMACLSVTTLSLGSHSLTAHYGGDTYYLASTSAPKTVTIGVVGQSGTNVPAGAQGSQTGPNGGPTGGPVASAPNSPSTNGNSQSPTGSAPQVNQATTRTQGGNPLLIVLSVLLGLMAASGGVFLLYRRRILTR